MKDRRKNNELPTDAHGAVSDAYLSAIVGASHDGIFCVDDQGRFEFGNNAFFQILGWPREELIGHPFIKVIPPDFHDFIMDRWEEVQRGEGKPYEVDILTQAGQRRSLFVSHTDVDVGGKRKYCVVVKDVTEHKQTIEALQKAHDDLEDRVRERTAELASANAVLERRVADHQKAEEALQNTAKKLSQAQRVSRTGRLDWNLKTNLVEMSGEAIRIFQVDPAKNWLSPELAASVIHPDDQDRVNQSLQSAIRGEKNHDLDHRIVRPDGEILWVHGQAELSRDADGNPESLLGVVVDITERKQAEQALESEGRLLRELLDLHERERKLVAHEIHDGFVQDVVSAKMVLEGAICELESQGFSQSSTLQPVGDLLARAIAEGRRMISELRPLIIDEQGVLAAIEHLIAREYTNSSPQVELSSSWPVDRLSPMLEGAVFRIVQEALTNVKRHSQADSASVVLMSRNGQLLIEIRDQGIGFDPDGVVNERFGLRGIRERARLFGGRATIESRPGDGTRVTVELPLSQEVTEGAKRVNGA